MNSKRICVNCIYYGALFDDKRLGECNNPLSVNYCDEPEKGSVEVEFSDTCDKFDLSTSGGEMFAFIKDDQGNYHGGRI